MLIRRFIFALLAWLNTRVVYPQITRLEPSEIRAVNTPTIHNKPLLVNVGRNLTGGVFTAITNTGISMCAKECLLRKRCKVIGFNMNTLLCELGDDLNATELTSDIKMVIGYPSDWGNDQSLAGICAMHTCESGQRCVELTSQNLYFCIQTECANPPSRANTTSSFDSSDRTVGSVVNYGTCAAATITHGQQTITCLASGHWSSYDYACCSCDLSYTVIVDCECSQIRGPKKSYQDAFGSCISNEETFTVINAADQLQRLSAIATSESVRIDGKYFNSQWQSFGGTVLSWIDDLPDRLKDFSSDPATLAFQMTGNEVVLVDISYSEKKEVLCRYSG